MHVRYGRAGGRLSPQIAVLKSSKSRFLARISVLASWPSASLKPQRGCGTGVSKGSFCSVAAKYRKLEAHFYEEISRIKPFPLIHAS